MNFNEEHQTYQISYEKQNDYICSLLDENSKIQYLEIINQIDFADQTTKQHILSILSKLQQVFIAAHYLKNLNDEFETYSVKEATQLVIQKPESTFFFESLIIQVQATLDLLTPIICHKLANNGPIVFNKYYYSNLIKSSSSLNIDLSSEVELQQVILKTLTCFNGLVYNTGTYQGGSLRNQTVHKTSINELIFTEFTINGYAENKALRLEQYVNDFPMFNSSIMITKSVLEICMQTIYSLIIKNNTTSTPNTPKQLSFNLNWCTSFIAWKDFISQDSSDDVFSLNKFKRGVISIRELVHINKSIYGGLSDVKTNIEPVTKCITNVCKDQIAVIEKS